MANIEISDAVIQWFEQKPGEDHGYMYRRGIRPELAIFVFEMERVLRENDSFKSGWDTMSLHQLVNRIKDEFEELLREYILQTRPIDKVDRRERIRHEAIDLANFCMFLSYWTHKED